LLDSAFVLRHLCGVSGEENGERADIAATDKVGDRPGPVDGSASRISSDLADELLSAFGDVRTDSYALSSPTSSKRPRRHRHLGAPSTFVVSAKGSAVTASIVAIAALAALAVVADSKNADGLATIALALAILAFVVQILVFIAQAQTSHQQMLQSEELNTETRSLLSEVQTTARATETLVREQFREVLKALIEASNSSGDGRFDSEALERRLLESVKREVAPPKTPTQPLPDPSRARARFIAERSRRRSEMIRQRQSFPGEEEGRPALQRLKSLTPAAQARLRAYADDEIQSIENGTYLGLPVADPLEDHDRELVDRHLVSRFRRTDDGRMQTVGRLTEAGQLLARLLLAVGEIPEWAADELPAVPPAPRQGPTA